MRLLIPKLLGTFVSATLLATFFLNVGLPVTASAAGDTVAPDLGLYCVILGRTQDTSGLTDYFKSAQVTYAHPICHYVVVLDTPSAIAPGAIVGDWGSACRTDYGQQAYAHRQANGGVVCENASYSYYLWAQGHLGSAPLRK